MGKQLVDRIISQLVTAGIIATFTSIGLVLVMKSQLSELSAAVAKVEARIEFTTNEMIQAKADVAAIDAFLTRVNENHRSFQERVKLLEQRIRVVEVEARSKPK